MAVASAAISWATRLRSRRGCPRCGTGEMRASLRVVSPDALHAFDRLLAARAAMVRLQSPCCLTGGWGGAWVASLPRRYPPPTPVNRTALRPDRPGRRGRRRRDRLAPPVRGGLVRPGRPKLHHQEAAANARPALDISGRCAGLSRTFHLIWRRWSGSCPYRDAAAMSSSCDRFAGAGPPPMRCSAMQPVFLSATSLYSSTSN